MSANRAASALGGYVVLEEIRRDSRGVVCRARHPALDRLVTIKVVSSLAGPGGEQGSYEDSFLEEARRAARLCHPGIVTILDVGKDSATGAIFLVFEQVDGRSLSQEIEDGRRFPWQEALRLVARVAEALQHAHENGLVHGRVGPANVVLLRSGEPKVTDFGTGRMTLPPPGRVDGALAYLSPEQVVGERVDSSTDIFSLGAVAYRLLTGRDAFGGLEARTIFSRILYDEPPPPSHVVGDLPPGVDELVARALPKSRKDRYPEAKLLAEDATDIIYGRLPRHLLKGEATSREALPPAVATRTGRVRSGNEPDLQRRFLTRGLAGILAFGLVAFLEALRPVAEPPATSTTPGPPTRVAQADPIAMPDLGLPSIVEPPQIARLVIDLRHPLSAGTLRVFVDGANVLERSVRGSVTKSILGIKLRGGHERQLLEIQPGRHRVEVQVQWEDEESSAVIEAGFKAGSIRRLSARMGRLRKDLKLAWE